MLSLRKKCSISKRTPSLPEGAPGHVIASHTVTFTPSCFYFHKQKQPIAEAAGSKTNIWAKFGQKIRPDPATGIRIFIKFVPLSGGHRINGSESRFVNPDGEAAPPSMF